MKRATEAALAAAILVVAPMPSRAQAFFEARIQPSLESWEASEEAQGAVAGSAAAEYRFADQHGRLYYGLDAGTYASPGDWSYLEHNAGLTWRVGDGRRRAYFGVRGTSRRNGLDWSAADYTGGLAMANLELGLTTASKLRLGYSVAKRGFSGLPQMDQVEQDGFASLLVNLPTRTTLLGEAHLGAKSYTGAVHARQVTWLGRVAQSLDDRTGLSLQASGRVTSGDVPSLLVTTPPAFEDDGVYDDTFASDALSLRAALKHVFQTGTVLEAEGWWQRKDYASTLALDAAGAPLASGELRRDRAWRGQLRAAVPLWPDASGPVAVTLELAYAFLDRSSNDAFHDQGSHGVLAAVSLRY
jgi:hypothetical protein